jgi:hypothetical protein
MAQMSKVNCKFGAPMGRHTLKGEPEKQYKFHLYNVRLDSGGYDDGGAYWGIGQRLYCLESACGDVTQYMRADDRKDAKEQSKAMYPKARFFR